MPRHAHPEIIRLGERRPYFGTADGPSGTTATLQGTGKVRIFDKDGAELLQSTSVTGQDSGATENPRVWYNLEPSVLGMVTDNSPYSLVFLFETLGSDGLRRVHEPTILVVVKEANE